VASCQRCGHPATALHPLVVPYKGERLVCGPCIRSFHEWWEKESATAEP
jgi:hypothetical protein